jgi:hypothetical protein
MASDLHESGSHLCGGQVVTVPDHVLLGLLAEVGDSLDPAVIVAAIEKVLAPVGLTPAQRMKLREIAPEIIEQATRDRGIG